MISNPHYPIDLQPQNSKKSSKFSIPLCFEPWPELFAAKFALKALFAGMNSFVYNKSGFMLERLITIVTLVRPLAGMNSSMFGQIFFTLECFSTVLAFERFLASMNPFMVF